MSIVLSTRHARIPHLWIITAVYVLMTVYFFSLFFVPGKVRSRWTLGFHSGYLPWYWGCSLSPVASYQGICATRTKSKRRLHRVRVSVRQELSPNTNGLAAASLQRGSVCRVLLLENTVHSRGCGWVTHHLQSALRRFLLPLRKVPIVQ